MTTTDLARQEDLFDAYIIPSRLAITSMRDSGYKNTAYALAELIDNAQQAGASMIELLCLQTYERIRQRERARLSKIAVLDNGKGMDHATLRIALQFGNGKLPPKTGPASVGLAWDSRMRPYRRPDAWTSGVGRTGRTTLSIPTSTFPRSNQARCGWSLIPFTARFPTNGEPSRSSSRSREHLLSGRHWTLTD